MNPIIERIDRVESKIKIILNMAIKLKEQQQGKQSLIFVSQEKNSKINLSSQLVNEASPATDELKEKKKINLFQDLVNGTKKNQISLSTFKNNHEHDESPIFQKSEIFSINKKLNYTAKIPFTYNKSENELELMQKFEYKLEGIKSGEESED